MTKPGEQDPTKDGEKGGAEGAQTDPAKPGAEGAGGTQTDPAKGGAEGGAASGEKPAGEGGKTFTEAELATAVEAAITRRDADAAEVKRKADEAAETERLANDKKFEELAGKHQKRIAELEPVAAKAERYEKALTTLLDSERKGIPDHLVPLLDRMDVAEQLEYIAANRDKLKVAEGGGGGGSQQRPIPGTNPGGDGKPAALSEEQKRAAAVSAGSYW